MEAKQTENMLFVTRGNQLQLFDFESEQIVSKYTFESDIDALDLTSAFSPAKHYYFVN